MPWSLSPCVCVPWYSFHRSRKTVNLLWQLEDFRTGVVIPPHSSLTLFVNMYLSLPLFSYHTHLIHVLFLFVCLGLSCFKFVCLNLSCFMLMCLGLSRFSLFFCVSWSFSLYVVCVGLSRFTFVCLGQSCFMFVCLGLCLTLYLFLFLFVLLFLFSCVV